MKSLINSLSLALIICSTPLIAGGFGSAGMVQSIPVNFIVTNNTDQVLTLAGRYEVRPSENPALLDMPNPFVYKTVPSKSKKVTITFDTIKTGGRLGALVEVTIRTPDNRIVKSFKRPEGEWAGFNLVTINPADLTAAK